MNRSVCNHFIFHRNAFKLLQGHTTGLLWPRTKAQLINNEMYYFSYRIIWILSVTSCCSTMGHPVGNMMQTKGHFYTDQCTYLSSPSTTPKPACSTRVTLGSYQPINWAAAKITWKCIACRTSQLMPRRRKKKKHQEHLVIWPSIQVTHQTNKKFYTVWIKILLINPSLNFSQRKHLSYLSKAEL